MLQPSPVQALPRADRFSAEARRRLLAIGLALAIEGLLLLLLISFNAARRPEIQEEVVTVADVVANEESEDAPESSSAESARSAEEQRTSQPSPQRAPSPQAEPLPAQAAQPSPPTPAVPPTPTSTPAPVPSAPSAPRTARPAAPSGPVFGPVDTGGSPGLRDTERVGTAPNGEPLYAAAWHREPRPETLRNYLSTARGPGWGLIACRTAPNYRVEDCVALDEYPEGSQINRAILAAAWEFEVRPPRRGGRPLVGSWVRIRIDYRVQQR